MLLFFCGKYSKLVCDVTFVHIHMMPILKSGDKFRLDTKYGGKILSKELLNLNPKIAFVFERYGLSEYKKVLRKKHEKNHTEHKPLNGSIYFILVFIQSKKKKKQKTAHSQYSRVSL